MPQNQSKKEFKKGDYVQIIGNIDGLKKVGKIIKPCPFAIDRCYHIRIKGNIMLSCINKGYLQKLSREEAILYAI